MTTPGESVRAPAKSATGYDRVTDSVGNWEPRRETKAAIQAKDLGQWMKDSRKATVD